MTRKPCDVFSHLSPQNISVWAPYDKRIFFVNAEHLPYKIKTRDRTQQKMMVIKVPLVYIAKHSHDCSAMRLTREDSRLTELAENTRTAIWSSHTHRVSVCSVPGTITKIEDNHLVTTASTQQRFFPICTSKEQDYLENLQILYFSTKYLLTASNIVTRFFLHCQRDENSWITFNSLIVWNDNSRMFLQYSFSTQHCFDFHIPSKI